MNIKGLHVTLGVNYNIDYNLSEVYRNNPNREVLEPVEWLQHQTPQATIKVVYGDLNGIIRTPSSLHPVIYVRSRLLWLMYLDHCLGNINQQIQDELDYLLPDGAA